MWPFKKPKLNDRVSIDMNIVGWDLPVDYRNINKGFLNKFLTGKQIRHINSLVPPEAEKIDVKKCNDLAWKNKTRDIAEEKRKEEFTEIDHIKTPEDYDAYMKNNIDKMMLTPDEQEKVMKLLGDVIARKDEIAEKISKFPKGTIWFNKGQMEDTMAEILTKSAKNAKNE